MNNATRAQSMQHLKLIDDQGLDLKESDTLNLYLPAFAQSVKLKKIPPLGEFRKFMGLGVLERLPFEVLIPTLAEPFDPKDKFVVDISDSAPVKISSVGGNFGVWFITSVVPARAGYGLEPFTLTGDASDEEILLDAAREDVDTDIAAVHFLISKQPKGPKSDEGLLLTNGCANIFYALQQIAAGKKIRALRRAVGMNWSGGGWRFCAVPYPNRWHAGLRVFLRKPLDTVPG